MKAFLITRVSDPSQREALPAQKYKLEDYAKRLRVDEDYNEFDRSKKTKFYDYYSRTLKLNKKAPI